MEFIPGMQSWFGIQNSIKAIYHIKITKKKNYIIIWQNPTHLWRKESKKEKTSQHLRNSFFNLKEGIYEKPTVITDKNFFFKSGQCKDVYFPF
jgi:hypothetical protein